MIPHTSLLRPVAAYIVWESTTSTHISAPLATKQHALQKHEVARKRKECPKNI
jgi:hypothetical protein